MPLSAPAARKLLHLRDILIRGYEREDGLVDIEAHMTDTKSYVWENRDRGVMEPGIPLHDMWMRLTIDRQMVIRAVDVAMDATPHSVCPGIAPNYQRLVGLSIAKGFLKAAMAVLGGVEGCTHLRELLQQVGTVAFQTMYSVRGHARPDDERRQGIPPSLLNTCYAYGENGPLMARLKAETQAGG